VKDERRTHCQTRCTCHFVRTKEKVFPVLDRQRLGSIPSILAAIQVQLNFAKTQVRQGHPARSARYLSSAGPPVGPSSQKKVEARLNRQSGRNAVDPVQLGERERDPSYRLVPGSEGDDDRRPCRRTSSARADLYSPNRIAPIRGFLFYFPTQKNVPSQIIKNTATVAVGFGDGDITAGGWPAPSPASGGQTDHRPAAIEVTAHTAYSTKGGPAQKWRAGSSFGRYCRAGLVRVPGNDAEEAQCSCGWYVTVASTSI